MFRGRRGSNPIWDCHLQTDGWCTLGGLACAWPLKGDQLEPQPAPPPPPEVPQPAEEPTRFVTWNLYVFTLAGRKDNTCTERERSLLADAGMQLAMASCNTGLARECGLSSTALKLSLDELHLNSLPTPALAVRWPEILQENFQLLDQRFLRPEEAPNRHLQ